MTKPSPWEKVVKKEISHIRGVCLDIDDTLSSHGKLTADAYAALWSLKKAGFAVVPVTGRPAGWCDMIARFWPVDAVIGENGAFSFFIQDKKRHRLDTPGVQPNHQEKLKVLGKKILARFPHAKWASDQAYREFDLAIDFCEDVPPWKKTEIDDLVKLCEDEGAYAKISSIHVNTWFGDYDKNKGLKHWLSQGAPGLDLGKKIKSPPSWDNWIFIGDSPNDEPLFKSFKQSVGVSNLVKYLDYLKHPPTWITSSESGKGFAEMAYKLVDFIKF